MTYLIILIYIYFSIVPILYLLILLLNYKIKKCEEELEYLRLMEELSV